MRIRAVTALLALTCVVMPNTGGCTKGVSEKPPSLGGKLIEIGAGSYPRWSRDGRSLYYNHATTICHYDTLTGRESERKLPKGAERFFRFDISPDGQALVFVDNGEAVRIVDLKRSSLKTIFSSQQGHDQKRAPASRVEQVLWLTEDRVVFTQQGPDGTRYAYSIRVDGRNLSRLAADSRSDIFAANDGCGFVYVGMDGKFYLYDLAHSSSKRVLSEYDGNSVQITLMYLSKRMLVYHKRGRSDRDTGTVEVCSLPAGRIENLGAYEYSTPMDLSALFANLVYVDYDLKNWNKPMPTRLCMRALPRQMTRRLRQLDKP